MKSNLVYNHNSIFQVQRQHLFWGEDESPYNLAQVSEHVWTSFLANSRHMHILTHNGYKVPNTNRHFTNSKALNSKTTHSQCTILSAWRKISRLFLQQVRICKGHDITSASRNIPSLSGFRVKQHISTNVPLSEQSTFRH